jgi:hypothetical protein
LKLNQSYLSIKRIREFTAKCVKKLLNFTTRSTKKRFHLVYKKRMRHSQFTARGAKRELVKAILPQGAQGRDEAKCARDKRILPLGAQRRDFTWCTKRE